MSALPILDIYKQIENYFWPALRILALFSTAPIFSEKEIGKKVKIGLALLVTFLISSNLPTPEVVLFSFTGLWVGAKQILIGCLMGFTIQLIFVAVRTAGEVIGLQMGLSFATFFDPNGGQNMPVIARFFNLLVTLLFLSFNGHLWLLKILSESFYLLPVNADVLHHDGFWSLLRDAGMIFQNGLMLGLPIITLLLAINFTLGLINRLTPQLSIFVIGFPLTLTIGMVALSLIMYTLSPFFEKMLLGSFQNLLSILQQLR